MSDNLPDFLNDNPGVAAAAAGLAVRRSIQITNSSVQRLQKELGTVKDELTKQREEVEREQERLDKLMRISIHVDAVSLQPASARFLLQATEVADEFAQQNFESSDFRTLANKELFHATEKKLDQMWQKVSAALPIGTIEQVLALGQWRELEKTARQFLALDAKAAATESELQVARSALEKMSSAADPTTFFSLLRSKHVILIAATTVVLISAVGSMYFVASGLLLPTLGTLAGGALLIALHCLKKYRNLEQTRQEPLRAAARLVAEHEKALKKLQSARSAALPFSGDISCIPADLASFLFNPALPISDRLGKLSEISAYTKTLMDSLGVDAGLMTPRILGELRLRMEL